MLYVSIFVELLRSRPALAVWIAALAQAALWTLVPALFYSGPPGDLPFVLAIGNELQLGTYLGPPLAFWLAEGAYVLAGNSLFGVYLLSQICVVVTYYGGVRARPLDRRRAACGDGGAADGRHLGVCGADAGLRPGHADHGAVVGHPAALLARGERRQARLLGRAGGGDRPPVPDHLCRAAAARRAGAVHRRQQARPRRDALDRSVAREPCCPCRLISASAVAVGDRRWADDAADAAAFAGSGDREFQCLAAPDRIHPRRPCRARGAGVGGGRLAVDAARAVAGDRARAGRAVCATVHHLFRDRAGARRDHRRGAGRLAVAGRRRSRRWSCFPVWRSWCSPATASSSATSTS